MEEEEEEEGQHGDIDFGTKYGSHQDPTHQCTVHWCTEPATRYAVVKVHHHMGLQVRAEKLCFKTPETYAVGSMQYEVGMQFPKKTCLTILQKIKYCTKLNVAQNLVCTNLDIAQNEYCTKYSPKIFEKIFPKLPLLCSGSPHYYAFPPPSSSLSLSHQNCKCIAPTFHQELLMPHTGSLLQGIGWCTMFHAGGRKHKTSDQAPAG